MNTLLGEGRTTALQAAVFNENKAMVQFLLENGADVNLPSRKFGTALQMACGQRRVDPENAVMQLLLEHGADVYAPAGRFGTAIQLAAKDKDKLRLLSAFSLG